MTLRPGILGLVQEPRADAHVPMAASDKPVMCQGLSVHFAARRLLACRCRLGAHGCRAVGVTELFLRAGEVLQDLEVLPATGS